MTKTTEWFIAERVRALSMMYLTRREDLHIFETRDDVGIDLSAALIKDGSVTARRFGIVLRGDRLPVSDAAANRQLKPSVQTFARSAEFTFPVCLFYFTMEDNKGRFIWIAEPVVAEDGRPSLVIHREASCHLLDTSAINSIVEVVDEWYDCLVAALR
jgi:hypothetical protein